MALSENLLLGKWLTYPILSRKFGEKWYATQSTQDGGFVVRGRGITKNADFVKESGVAAADIETLESSDDYGVVTPSSFVEPAGYISVTKNNTLVYYPKSLVDANPSLAIPTGGEGSITAANSASTFYQSVVDWVKANPLQSVAIAVAAYLIYDNATAKRGRKSILSKLF